MKQVLVRYKTKPEQAQENAQLIAQVFAELKAKSPEGVRYLCLKLDDGTFVHFAAVEATGSPNPITSLDAFQAFQRGIEQRCIELPRAGDAIIVGNYRMVAG
jgi:hypothetical protein